jgi:hypothetical protein
VVIKLQILLHKAWRTPQGIDTVKKIAESLGIKPTASGAATLSGEIEPQAFESLFIRTVKGVRPPPPGKRDFGVPAGAGSGLLAIPEPLREYVESITVAPPYILMKSPSERSRNQS